MVYSIAPWVALMLQSSILLVGFFFYPNIGKSVAKLSRSRSSMAFLLVFSVHLLPTFALVSLAASWIADSYQAIDASFVLAALPAIWTLFYCVHGSAL